MSAQADISGWTAEALDLIALECAAQDARWGRDRDMPDGTDESHAEALVAAREAIDAHARTDSVTWADVLTEEFWEAVVEHDPERLRGELLQLAAVASQWAGAIERRQVTGQQADAGG